MRLRLLAVSAIIAVCASGSTALGFEGNASYYSPPASSASYGPAGIFGDAHLGAAYFDGGNADGGALGLGGVVVVPLGNGWNTALEADAGYLFGPGDWVAGTTGHFFANRHSWAAGGFVEITTEDVFALGAEGAVFFNNIDAVADVSYNFSTPEYWDAAYMMNFYVDPDTALSAGLEGAWFDGGGDAQLAFVGIEHRFRNSPVSGFADLGWDNFSGGNTYSGLAGARIVFGDAGHTLQEYNRANPF